MSFNLLDSVKGLFSNELIDKAASTLGESEGGIRKALGGAVPTVLAGLLGKSGTYEGASGLLDMAKKAAGSGITANLGGLLGTNQGDLVQKGEEMLKSLMGDKLGYVSNLIASHAGVKPASASSLLSMAAPAALNTLGNHAVANNLSATGISQLLSSQKETILGALPGSLSSLGAILGLTTIGGSPSHASTGNGAVHVNPGPASGSKFLIPILMAIAAVVLAIFMFKSCGSDKKSASTAVGDTSKIENTVPMAETPAGPQSIKVKLPNGVELDAYQGGIEDRLVAFLGTDYASLGADSLKKIWFDFDQLNFKTASAELTPESQKQVDNLTAILKAFPNAKLKIGGYTDKTGNEQSNLKLSDARAKAVQAALGKAGVGAQITAAEGYGSSQAKFAADAPESDRVKDRHVSVSIRL